jgi:hypothetical protein
MLEEMMSKASVIALAPAVVLSQAIAAEYRLHLDVDRVMSIHSLNPARLTSVADMKASLGRL